MSGNKKEEKISEKHHMSTLKRGKVSRKDRRAVRQKGKGASQGKTSKFLSHGIGLVSHLKYFRDVVKDLFKYYKGDSKTLYEAHLAGREQKGLIQKLGKDEGRCDRKLHVILGLATSTSPAIKVDVIDKKSGRRETGFDWAEVSTEGGKDKLQNEFDMKLNTIKSELKSVIGMKPFKIHQYLSGTHTAVVTSGVVAGVITIDAMLFNEWASLAALFDEYRVLGGTIKFVTINTTAGPMTANGMYVWCYDPTDSTALTSTAAGCEYSQHSLFALPYEYSGVGAAAPGKRPYEFVFKVPKDPMYGVAVADEGMWLPTASPLPFGFVKTYVVGQVVTAIACTNWLVQLEVEFRSRQ